jgi:hypothetical protein
MKTVTILAKALLFSASLALANAAHAQDALAQAPEAAATSGAEVMSNDDLSDLSGGAGVTITAITNQTLTAINTGNTVNGETVTSGDVNVGANAFSGFDGVGNFVINTGHNNNLQSTMNVTVVLAPPAAPGG